MLKGQREILRLVKELIWIYKEERIKDRIQEK